MSTYLYLAITDGTTAIVFATGTGAVPGDYSVDPDWAPAIAQRSTDDLGGGGLIADVEEVIPINITGSSVAAMYANVGALATLLDQADRWSAGDPTAAPVRLQYIPAGSPKTTATPYECLILGSATEGMSALSLPTGRRGWSRAAAMRFVLGAVVQIRRQGRWLCETDTASSAATTNSNVFTITLPNHQHASPVDLAWGIPSAAATTEYRMGGQILAVSEDAADLGILEANIFVGTTQFASLTTTNARGGTVLQLVTTATPSTPMYSPLATFPSGVMAAPGPWALFAQCVLPNAAYRTQIWLVIHYQDGSTLTTQRVTITAPTTGLPGEPLPLGIIMVPPNNGIAWLQLGMVSDTASIAVATIDAMLAVRVSPRARIYQIDSGILARTTTLDWAVGSMDQRIEHQLLTARAPRMTIGRADGTLRVALPAVGDPTIVQRGTTLAGAWLAGNVVATGTGYANGQYRCVTQAGSLYASVATATRRRGYLVPE